ncbi:MAG: hypothetical protein ACI4SR_02965 [Faecalibacillus sp.]
MGFSYYMSTVSSTDPGVKRTAGNQVMACKDHQIEDRLLIKLKKMVLFKMITV